ncbi:hypothetical protein HWV62_4585 [Athelia sp. TMB]|nr:hypothetical protein HWV62_4585 [Athelia sp. TMB]
MLGCRAELNSKVNLGPIGTISREPGCAGDVRDTPWSGGGVGCGRNGGRNLVGGSAGDRVSSEEDGDAEAGRQEAGGGPGAMTEVAAASPESCQEWSDVAHNQISCTLLPPRSTLPFVRIFGDDEKADLLAPGNTIDTIDLSSTPSPPPDEDALSEASEASEPCTVNRTRRSSSALSLPLPLPIMHVHAAVPLHSPTPLVGTPFDPRTSFEYPFPPPPSTVPPTHHQYHHPYHHHHAPLPLWLQGHTHPYPRASTSPVAVPSRPASAGPSPDRDRDRASPTHRLRARLMRGAGEPPVPPGLVKRRRISEAALRDFGRAGAGAAARSPSEGSVLPPAARVGGGELGVDGEGR